MACPYPTMSAPFVAMVVLEFPLDVLRAIENLLSILGPEHQRNFAPMSTTVEIGNGATRESKAYTLTRDGYTLLTIGSTGKRALAFKLAYIEAFNRMEGQLHGGQAQPAGHDGTLKSRVQEAAQLAAAMASPLLQEVLRASLAADLHPRCNRFLLLAAQNPQNRPSLLWANCARLLDEDDIVLTKREEPVLHAQVSALMVALRATQKTPPAAPKLAG